MGKRRDWYSRAGVKAVWEERYRLSRSSIASLHWGAAHTGTLSTMDRMALMKSRKSSSLFRDSFQMCVPFRGAKGRIVFLGNPASTIRSRMCSFSFRGQRTRRCSSTLTRKMSLQLLLGISNDWSRYMPSRNSRKRLVAGGMMLVEERHDSGLSI